MSWLTDLADIVPPPHTRVPLSLESFTQLFLPSLLLYYATAVLVLIPNTFYARLALLPVTLWAAFRTGTRLDIPAPWNDERLIYLNQGLTLAMSTLATRAVIWTFKVSPLYRTPNPKIPHTPSTKRLTLPLVLKDSFELCFNLRGIGWNWSAGLHIPQESKPTHSRSLFLLYTTRNFLFALGLFDALHYAVQSFGPTTIGAAVGGSIFDSNLPFVQRYLRSTFITYLAGLTICLGIQIGFYFMSIVGVAIFRNTPESWPPIFDAPWVSTSLSEFWAKRWHQAFRDLFVTCGSRPLARLFGRMGTVLGAFIISGLLHVAGLWGMGRGTEFWGAGGYFVMMGVGVIIERAWAEAMRKSTGEQVRVQGWAGWLWTMAWVVFWGNWLVDAWARKGLCGSIFFPEGQRPVDAIWRVVGNADWCTSIMVC